MNIDDARQAVLQCLRAIKPDLGDVAVDLPLLESRVITSFDVLDLILHLEKVSGRAVTRQQLQPGSFRDIDTIARVFLMDGGTK